MSHLFNFREGWQSEKLAQYILSKIAFVSQPVTTSDDVGTDFFCTLFDIKKEDKNNFILPKNSFAIQVKSKDKKDEIEITNKESYIRQLEVPFFWGIVDKKAQKIVIYSGEFFEIFIAHIGGVPKGQKLFIKLTDTRNENKGYYEEKNKWYINFPKIVEISINFNYLESAKAIQPLFKACELMLKNIAARIKGINMFEMDSGSYFICTGPYSARIFRKNVYNVLTEAFYNLAYLKKTRGKGDKEFKIYLTFYNAINKLRNDIPDDLYLAVKRASKQFK
ncbi:MAG: hypothetical protein KKB39_03655 [Nanoarchaeota archaeon]|nr:hypothetical protein [Nanoarchaeota archaeon]